MTKSRVFNGEDESLTTGQNVWGETMIPQRDSRKMIGYPCIGFFGLIEWKRPAVQCTTFDIMIDSPEQWQQENNEWACLRNKIESIVLLAELTKSVLWQAERFNVFNHTEKEQSTRTQIPWQNASAIVGKLTHIKSGHTHWTMCQNSLWTPVWWHRGSIIWSHWDKSYHQV